MRIVAFKRFGGPEVLRLLEAERPNARAGTVIIRVAFTSVNPIDWKIRRGFGFPVLVNKLPRVVGFDISGHDRRSRSGGRELQSG